MHKLNVISIILSLTFAIPREKRLTENLKLLICRKR
jgi:hypothetical protein